MKNTLNQFKRNPLEDEKQEKEPKQELLLGKTWGKNKPTARAFSGKQAWEGLGEKASQTPLQW